MAVTVLYSAVLNIQGYIKAGKDGWQVNVVLTAIMMALAVIVSVVCIAKWVAVLSGRAGADKDNEPKDDLMKLAEGIEISE
jgi:cation transporter-like permease